MSDQSHGGWVRVRGPASLSNMGPGFDSIGACLQSPFDVVEARRDPVPGVRIEMIAGDDGVLPLEPERNTASVAAARLLDQENAAFGLVLRIFKHIPLGSGIGGSAASAVAGAMAANLLLDSPVGKTEMVNAVLAGEAVASGSEHGDNVLPALFGGVVLSSASNPRRYKRLQLPENVRVALFLPEIRVLTHEARALLPEIVSFRDAIENASDFGALVASLIGGDWPAVGRLIMTDRLVEPVRSRLIPCFNLVRNAAVKEGGAYGCAITGSGPAMFALAESDEHAHQISSLMVERALATGVSARGFNSAIDAQGTSEIITASQETA